MAITYEELREMGMLARDLFILKRILDEKKVTMAGTEVNLDESTLAEIKSVYDSKATRVKELSAKL